MTNNEKFAQELVRRIIAKTRALNGILPRETVGACLTGGKVAYLNTLLFFASIPEDCL